MPGSAMAEAKAIELDCVVIGAGWTGLATAAALRAYGVRSFVLLEAGPSVAAWWRGNYDRIRLHTPFHGLPCDDGAALYDYPMFKSKRLVLDYLQEYYDLHKLQEFTHFGQRVAHVANVGRRDWLIDVEAERGPKRYRCKFVAVCTSKLRRPYIPDIPGRESFAGRILHSREYRSGRAFVGQDVLVAGSGNSAAEIAADLVEQGAAGVTLLVNGPRYFVPLPRIGWLARLTYHLGAWREEAHYEDFMLDSGTVHFREAVAKKDQAMSKMAVDLAMFGIEQPTTGFQAANLREGRIGTFDQGAIDLIRARKIVVRKGHVVRFAGSEVVLSDGSCVAATAVVLATGFQPKLEEFLHEPERFLERNQEGKGCGLGYLTPKTDGRCRSTVDDSIFFVGFDQAVNGGFSMGFWGWSCGFLVAKALGLPLPQASFSLDVLPQRQRDVILRRRFCRGLAVLLFALATALLGRRWPRSAGGRRSPLAFGALGGVLAVAVLELGGGWHWWRRRLT